MKGKGGFTFQPGHGVVGSEKCTGCGKWLVGQDMHYVLLCLHNQNQWSLAGLVAYAGHEQEGLFQFFQGRPCTKQNNVVSIVMRPQNTRDQLCACRKRCEPAPNAEKILFDSHWLPSIRTQYICELDVLYIHFVSTPIGRGLLQTRGI